MAASRAVMDGFIATKLASGIQNPASRHLKLASARR